MVLSSMIVFAMCGTLTIMNVVDARPATLPDGSSVPVMTNVGVASLSVPHDVLGAAPKGPVRTVTSSVSTNDIPVVAASAYRRAATVIDSVDTSCHLGWNLIAAIGRVESDHGRYGGSTLTADGTSIPGIYGIALDGTHSTAKIIDSDHGTLDKDATYDRAIGSMQFLPSTWKSVAVDADNDGKKDPQNINDAALAAAVYLCAGSGDLSTTSGMRKAVLRYNHSDDYADEVLAISRSYGNDTYSAASSYYTTPSGSGYPATGAGGHPASHKASTGKGSGGTQATKPSKPRSPAPSDPPPTAKPAITADPVKPVVTALQTATSFCLSQLTGAQLSALGGVTACANAYVKGGTTAVQGLLNNLVGSLAGLSALLGG